MCKEDGTLNTPTDPPVMEGRELINTYILTEILQHRKGHDFESQPHINCVPLSKSLMPIKAHFILLNNNPKESTLYTIKHRTHLQCSVQNTTSIKLRSLQSKDRVEKKFNNF